MSRPPWAAHFGLTRTPFGKAIPAAHLFHRQAHAEAVARITFCVLEAALGVVTGDVGAGKTVSVRAAVAGLDPTRHQIIYIANPIPAALRPPLTPSSRSPEPAARTRSRR